ncbi:MAG: tRNA preQ1(34) S-adenosylmethionine ribosyltransferase-isomerase QueA [Victivallales bacterium]|nr:tRNA preQ1(34) S-adenosylmethionine ribosyltransferase-isomerase QueA [Victivallales bacterium]
MRTDLFKYDLPEELIAQFPSKDRDASRMLVLDRVSGECELRMFKDIIDYLTPADCMVSNNTRVMSARMYGLKNGNPDGAMIEILLMEARDASNLRWQCMLKPGKRVQPGTEVRLVKQDGSFGDDDWFRVCEHYPDGTFEVEFNNPDNFSLQEKYGHMPLPPYIKRSDSEFDQERYQTVFAKESGAVAAPTAGLHFTPEILKKIADKGTRHTHITLHVGAGTFKPVAVENVLDHKMHTERYVLSQDTADMVNSTRVSGGRVLAIGTTSVRVLESCADADGKLSARTGSTDIFIYPPYKPKCVDMLLTNFHLPESTLLMLVSAFAGRENVLKAYELAIREKMRFYSYGDCMLLK